MKVFIVDVNQAVIAACEAVGLEAFHGTIFEYPAGAIVSPANSFGFMDGGIDLAYSRKFGWSVQEKIQEKIRAEFDGELLVGQALTVTTGDADWPFLISAPTMRVPMIIPDPNNIRMATKAAMREAIRHECGSVAFPGMGAGTGQVRPEWVACMMRAGINDALTPTDFPRSLREASSRHYEARP